jgi:hypothetical protein
MKIIDIIKTIKVPLECLCDQGIPVHYVHYTNLYDDYCNLIKQPKQKKCNAILKLSERHAISESAAYKIIKIFEKETQLN